MDSYGRTRSPFSSPSNLTSSRLPPPNLTSSRPPPPNLASSQSQQFLKMKVQKCSSDQLALSNYLIVSSKDFHPNVRYVLVEEKFVFTIKYVVETFFFSEKIFSGFFSGEGNNNNNIKVEVVKDNR